MSRSKRWTRSVRTLKCVRAARRRRSLSGARRSHAPDRGVALAMRWIIAAARVETTMVDRLAAECGRRGDSGVRQKREDTHPHWRSQQGVFALSLVRNRGNGRTMARSTPIERYRNIAHHGHIDAGKTATTERILHYTGKVLQNRRSARRHGANGLDGTGAGARHHDHVTATTFWRDHRVNIIDTPGHVDFTIEVERSLRVLNLA